MNDLSLGYDVCNIWLQHPSDVATYRARSDNGNCQAALDPKCVDALQSMASTEASVAAHSVPITDQANSSAAQLPTVCTKIGNKIKSSFPKECKRYFNSEALWPAREYNDFLRRCDDRRSLR